MAHDTARGTRTHTWVPFSGRGALDPDSTSSDPFQEVVEDVPTWEAAPLLCPVPEDGLLLLGVLLALFSLRRPRRTRGDFVLAPLRMIA